MQMVLGDPGRIEAEPFGVDDLRGRQPIPFGGVRLIEQPREETQAFRQRGYRHPRLLCISETASEICWTAKYIVFFLSRHPEVVLAEDVVTLQGHASWPCFGRERTQRAPIRAKSGPNSRG